MASVTRKELLDSLGQEWGTYVERYRNLTEDEKKRFVKKQGYARFADILAHFIAWWEEGIKALERMPIDPAYQSPEFGVDEFNAQAVKRYSGSGEEEIINTFEGGARPWSAWSPACRKVRSVKNGSPTGCTSKYSAIWKNTNFNWEPPSVLVL